MPIDTRFDLRISHRHLPRINFIGRNQRVIICRPFNKSDRFVPLFSRDDNLTAEPTHIRVDRGGSKHLVPIIITQTGTARNPDITGGRLIKPNKMKADTLKLVGCLLIRHEIKHRPILKRQRFPLPRPRTINRSATQRRSGTPLPDMFQNVRLNQRRFRAHNTPIHRDISRIKPFKLTQMLRHKPNIQTLQKRTDNKRGRFPKPVTRSRTNRFRFPVKKMQLRIRRIPNTLPVLPCRSEQLQRIIISNLRQHSKIILKHFTLPLRQTEYPFNPILHRRNNDSLFTHSTHYTGATSTQPPAN